MGVKSRKWAWKANACGKSMKGIFGFMGFFPREDKNTCVTELRELILWSGLEITHQWNSERRVGRWGSVVVKGTLSWDIVRIAEWWINDHRGRFELAKLCRSKGLGLKGVKLHGPEFILIVVSAGYWLSLRAYWRGVGSTWAKRHGSNNKLYIVEGLGYALAINAMWGRGSKSLRRDGTSD